MDIIPISVGGGVLKGTVRIAEKNYQIFTAREDLPE
jgi:hypothetical protein